MRAYAYGLAMAGLMSAVSVGSAGQSTIGATVQKHGTRIRMLIEQFDDCIQERFKDVDEGFGIRRIIRLGETPHRFRPENAREESAVRDFERDGIRVVLYLTGRRVLTEDAPADNEPRPTFTAIPPGRLFESSLIKGPVDVAPAAADDHAPPVPALDLRAESRRAMLTFDRESSYEFAAGGWTFIARPVRASDPSCLRCHDADGRAHTIPSPQAAAPTLKPGDALGAILYAYRPVH